MDDEKILSVRSCPFCGGVAEIVQVTRHIKGNLIVVKCSRCGASTKTFSEDKPENAVDAWNMRVSDWGRRDYWQQAKDTTGSS